MSYTFEGSAVACHHHLESQINYHRIIYTQSTIQSVGSCYSFLMVLVDVHLNVDKFVPLISSRAPIFQKGPWVYPSKDPGKNTVFLLQILVVNTHVSTYDNFHSFLYHLYLVLAACTPIHTNAKMVKKKRTLKTVNFTCNRGDHRILGIQALTSNQL